MFGNEMLGSFLVFFACKFLEAETPVIGGFSYQLLNGNTGINEFAYLGENLSFFSCLSFWVRDQAGFLHFQIDLLIPQWYPSALLFESSVFLVVSFWLQDHRQTLIVFF